MDYIFRQSITKLDLRAGEITKRHT